MILIEQGLDAFYSERYFYCYALRYLQYKNIIVMLSRLLSIIFFTLDFHRYHNLDRQRPSSHESSHMGIAVDVDRHTNR